VVAERFAAVAGSAPGSPDIAFEFMHVALPPSKVLPFRELCHERSEVEGVGLLECGLWTAPDFFSCVLVLPKSMGGQQRLGDVMDSLLAAAQDFGGSMEYVHGAGLRLAHLMENEHGSGLECCDADPRWTQPGLNPGAGLQTVGARTIPQLRIS
jgi:hypothetical protein